MDAETLFNRIRNEAKYCERLRTSIIGLRRMVDEIAEMQAKDNAEWHDDPEAEDHAEYHASAIEQFSRATRDKAVKDLVAFYLQEEIYEEHNRNAAQLRDIIANADHLELMVVRRQYADIHTALVDDGFDVDIQTVMVVVDQMASKDQYFVRLAQTVNR